MSLALIGFIVVFLAVFGAFILVARAMSRRAQAKEDQRAWEEGQRRRSQTTEDEAWKANKRMPMK